MLDSDFKKAWEFVPRPISANRLEDCLYTYFRSNSEENNSARVNSFGIIYYQIVLRV